MNKKAFHLTRPLNSKIPYSRFTTTAVILLSLSITWACNAQHSQGPAIKDDGTPKVGTQNMAKDTFPKGRRIGLKSEMGDYKYLFTFYDTTGKIVKEITDRQLPSYSKFKSLDFPKMKEVHGESVKEGANEPIYYNLRDLAFLKRKEVLQMGGVTGVPEGIIRQAKEIMYLGNSVPWFQEGNNYIVTTSVARFYDEGTQYASSPLYDQTHISVFDATGNSVSQLDVNYFVNNAMISDDGKYLLIFSVQGDYETPDLPILIHDFKANRTDTIDLTKEYFDIMPLYMLYADSFFQTLVSNSISLLINPYTRKLYIKDYRPIKIYVSGQGYQFRSMHLPDKSTINLQEYKIITY